MMRGSISILKSQFGRLINKRVTFCSTCLTVSFFLGIFEMLKKDALLKKALCQQFCHSSGRLTCFGRFRRPVIRQTGWIGSCVRALFVLTVL